jgi:hypothetical protein
LPTEVGYLSKLQSGQESGEEHVDELPWDSFWQFLQKMLWLPRPTDSSAVGVAGLRRFRRWRSRMWRSWAGVVTHGLRLWNCLGVLPNSQKQSWRWLMVEKWTLNNLATALMDIPAVSMPIARPLKTWDIRGIVLCDKTSHCRVAFYCPQHNLCNDHAVYLASWYDTPVRWMDYLGKGEMLTNRDVNNCVHHILDFLCVWNISGIFYFSSWNMGPTQRLYFCSVWTVLVLKLL